MLYKTHNIKKKDWRINISLPLSRFIEFEITKGNKISKFVFNRNFLNSMKEEVADESELEADAIEEIKKYIDNKVALEERLFFFERYPGNFLRSNIPPDWYLNISTH